jgi:hypothetical protein
MTLELEDVQNGHAGDWDVETIVSTSTGGRTLPGEYMRCLVLSLALTGLGYPDCWGHRGVRFLSRYNSWIHFSITDSTSLAV